MAQNNKKEIGKGIRALLANIESQEITKAIEGEKPAGSGINNISIVQIEVNPFQPRSEFDQQKMDELAMSIKTFGIIQPITVRRLSSNRYQLISGERRWRASQMAGLKAIPAYVRDADDQGMLEIALLENIQRSDLNPLEIGLTYQRLIAECDLTHEELSERLGTKRSTISNYLRLLKLPAPIQKALKQEFISLGHAKLLAGIDKTEVQLSILDKIVNHELSVRDTEREISKADVKPNVSVAKKETSNVQSTEVKKIADQLSERVGSRVEIVRSNSGKGQIKIHFMDDKEFNDVIEIILNPPDDVKN